MSECFVLGAGKRSHASKSISKRKCASPQTRTAQGLGCAMARARKQQNKGARSVLSDFQRSGSLHAGPNSPAAQRKIRIPPNASFYVQAVRPRRISSRVSAKVEGIDSQYLRAGYCALLVTGLR